MARTTSSSPFRMIVFLSAFFLVSFSSTTSATCWFPDGVTQDPDGFPCNTTASASQCCRTFEACLLGGVCYTQFDSQMYRRSCTDQTFSDPNCPQECKTSGPSGPEGILQCTGGTQPTYCCSGASVSCCNNGSFEFIPGGFQGVLDGNGVLNTPSANTVTTASPTLSSSTSTTSTTQTTSSSSTTASTAATQSTSTASAGASSSSHTGRTVGLAVGISLGVCAVAVVLGLWFWFGRRLARERRQREGLEARIQAAGVAAPKKPELSTEKLEHGARGTGVGGPGAAQEMVDSSRQELGDTAARTPHEVGSQTYRHEVM